MILCYRALSQAPTVHATKQGVLNHGESEVEGNAGRRSAKSQDAIALLKADHRQVEKWFEQFEKARTDDRKLELATDICNALKVHTTIEEEIFYPAFLEATEDKDLHHEAEIEHDGAKNLIAEIEASGPDDEYYDSKVKVLVRDDQTSREGRRAAGRHVCRGAQGEDGSRCARRTDGGAQGRARERRLPSTPPGARRGKNGILERMANAVPARPTCGW